MQPIGKVWNILVGDHPGISSVEFGQIPISGSGKEVVRSFHNIIQFKIVTPGRSQFWPQGHDLNKIGRKPVL